MLSGMCVNQTSLADQREDCASITRRSGGALRGFTNFNLTGVLLLHQNSWYGTQAAKERLVARVAGHVDSADAVATRSAWVRHRPVHSTIVRQRTPGRGGIAVPRSAAAG